MVTVSAVAWLKLTLHACKYPSKAVVGLLVGADGGRDAVTVVDAFPLCHDALAPAVIKFAKESVRVVFLVLVS
jgi:hypothetical protein